MKPLKKKVSLKRANACRFKGLYIELLNVVSVLMIGIRTWFIRMQGIAVGLGCCSSFLFPLQKYVVKTCLCFEGFIHIGTNNLFIPQLLFVLVNIINDIINSVL